MNREELRKIARDILDCKDAKERSKLIRSLSEEEQIKTLPFLMEIGNEKLAEIKADTDILWKEIRDLRSDLRSTSPSLEIPQGEA